jgi:hypothetical protein
MSNFGILSHQNFKNMAVVLQKSLSVCNAQRFAVSRFSQADLHTVIDGAYLHTVRVKYRLLTVGYSKSGNPKAKQTAWLPVRLVNKILLLILT